MKYRYVDPFHQDSRLRMFQKLMLYLLTAAVVCLPGYATASHLIGGDLRYKCLGNNQYEIRLIYRRDCKLGLPGTEFEDLASIGFFNSQNNAPILTIGTNGMIRIPRDPIDTANQHLINDCTLAGDDLCVEQTIYKDTVTLPLYQPGYTIVYQRCCRNQSLQNVYDPLNTGMTFVARLSYEAQLACNSSPDFNDYPPIFICVNDTLDYTFHAVDPDGDSLIYELFTPFKGASDAMPQPSPPPPPPYDTIVWNPPYNLGNLLGGFPLTIDRFTGRMVAVPNLIGQFLVGVKVYSYRNGMLIETTTREWQFNVRACKDPPISGIETSTDLSCNSLSIDFMQATSHADQLKWIFNYGDSNAVISFDSNPSFTYPAPGFYTAALVVNDLDSLCFDTAFATVGVFESPPVPHFNLDIPSCSQPIVIQAIDASSDPNPGFDVNAWQFILSYPGFADTTYTPLGFYILDSAVQNVNLNLTVTSSSGCTASIDTTFDANIIQLDLKGDTIGICPGDSALLFNAPGGPYTYTWSPTEGLLLTDPANPLAFPDQTTTYYVTVTDGLCDVSDSVVAAIVELPQLAFDAFTDCRSLQLDLENNSTGGFNYLWDFGDGSPLSSEMNPTHTYDSAGVYTVTLTSADGCDINISQQVTVSVITEHVEDQSISCFAQSVVLNPDGSSAYDYAWSPSQFLDADDVPSPVATVDQTTTFYVTITDQQFPGCSVLDSVTVVVGEDFDLAGPPDSAYCDAPAISLQGSNSDLSYSWFDIDSNLLAQGSEFLVSPDTQTSYIVVGTDNLGCSKSDTVTLSPTFFSLETSPDVVICYGDDTTVYITNLNTTQNLSYLWTPTDQIIGPNDVPVIHVRPGENGQTFVVQVTNNDVGCVTTDSVRVDVSLFNLEYTPNLLICRGDSIVLQVGNFGTDSLSFSWTPTGSILHGENTSGPTVMPTETTVYTAHITDLVYGCETTLDVTVNVSWFNPDSLVITVDKDSVVLNDDVFHIYTNQDPTLMFQWSGNPDIDNPNAPQITVTPTEEGMFSYTVTVTNQDGCQLIGSTQNLTVLNPECNENTVFIPDAFSPNGDGHNDVLHVYGNFIEQMELHIYNRWGQEVFKSFDQNTDWDGTYKGKELPPDVFGYYLKVVCTPNKPYFRKGNVTLIR